MPETPPRTLRLDQFRGAAVLIMASVLASRGIAYVRDSYVAYAFGAGRSTDAYNVAFTIPDLLNYLVAGGALSITFIPILNSLLEKRDEEEGYRVLSIVATFLVVVLTAATLLGEWFAPALLRWYQPGFTGEQLLQCTAMTRVLMPGALFFSLGGLFSAVLYTRGAFLIPALTPLVYNLSTLMGGILLGRWLGIYSLAIGTIAGALLGPFLMPLIAAFKHGMRYRPQLDLGNLHFQRWFRTSIPLMLGVSIVTADDWFIRYFAGNTVGAISHLNYAKRLTAVPIAVLGQAIGQAAMPFFSKLVNQGNWTLFRETVDRSVTRSVMAGIFAISLMEALALPAVRLVYERGRFNDADAQATAAYFSIFLLLLGCWIIQGIYARAFYATGNTLAPMVQSTVVTAMTLPVYFVFSRWFGIVGLAWASNVAILVQTIGMAWLLQRRGWLELDRNRWSEVGRTALAGFIAWAVAWFITRRIEPAQYHWQSELAVACIVSLAWLLIIAILSRLLDLRELRTEAARGWDKLRGKLATD